MPTDKERLDFLQEMTKGYGNGWLLRVSSTGRGMRLHETSQFGASADVRQAIDNYMTRGFRPKHASEILKDMIE